MAKDKLEILVENEDFVVVSKPSGMLSVPDRKDSEVSLKAILREKYTDIFVVHRLDRGTSGLIMFAKNIESQKELSKMFENRQMIKWYQGIVNGNLYPESGTVDAAIAPSPKVQGMMYVNVKTGKRAITDFHTLENFKNYTLASFQIHTGRTHQIRLHCQYLGHSIVCDEYYGDGKPLLLSEIKKKFNLGKWVEEEQPIMGRLALHSWKLAFDFKGQHFDLEAPLPKDMRATITQLQKNNK